MSKYKTMHDQYPAIWVGARCPMFWLCNDSEGGEKYEACEKGSPKAIFACEEVIGFGYGSVYPSIPSENDCEKWSDQGGWYAPTVISESPH